MSGVRPDVDYTRCHCGTGRGHPFDPGTLCPGVPTPKPARNATETAGVERERREKVLSFPKFTLLRIGWEVEPGRVQGGIFYRIGDGLGPTSRDTTARDNLNRVVMYSFDLLGQPWGVEVLAVPTSEALNSG